MENSYILHNIYAKYMTSRMFHVCSSVYYCCIISTLLHEIMIVNQIFTYIIDSEN